MCFSHESMSGGVWLGAHKMCAPEEPCFDPFGRGLEACFGPKPIFIKLYFSWDSGGLWAREIIRYQSQNDLGTVCFCRTSTSARSMTSRDPHTLPHWVCTPSLHTALVCWMHGPWTLCIEHSTNWIHRDPGSGTRHYYVADLSARHLSSRRFSTSCWACCCACCCACVHAADWAAIGCGHACAGGCCGRHGDPGTATGCLLCICRSIICCCGWWCYCCGTPPLTEVR